MLAAARIKPSREGASERAPWPASVLPPIAGKVALLDAKMNGVQNFDELVAEAERAPVDTWDFSWLEGRATEERPSWRYFDRVVERTVGISTLLELQAGVGAMIGNLPATPAFSVATEGFAPSVEVAAARLRSRGGAYLAQHVGPHSLRSLSEFLMGPLPAGSRRDPVKEKRDAEQAGLEVLRIDVERPRTVFYDVGAVVYFLRLVPWNVPDFSVTKYREALLSLHKVIQRNGAFETTASRTLVEATKPARALAPTQAAR